MTNTLAAVDANAHVVPAETRQSVIARGREHGSGAAPDATAEELLAFMEQAGVQQAALVPHPPNSYDNRYCIESAQRHPQSFVAVAKIDAGQPDAAENIAGMARQPGVGGLRFERRDANTAADWLIAPPVLRLWEAASATGLSVSLPAVRRMDELPAVGELLERFPEVPVILLHGLDIPPVEDGPTYEHAGEFFALSRYPNLYLAFTHHNLVAAERGASTARALLERVVETFGARRLMWVSFFPARAPVEAPLAGPLTAVRSALAVLPAADQELILGGTAQRLFPALRAGTR